MTAYDIEKAALRECGKPKRRKTDRERIIRLWTQPGGFWTQQEIAETCRCSVQTVRNVLIREGYQEIYEGDWGRTTVMRREKPQAATSARKICLDMPCLRKKHDGEVDDVL